VLLGTRQGPFWHARRVRPTKGEPLSVQFDGAWVLIREEERGDVVGFYHTHPGGPPDPSQRDVKTMHAWAGSFGKPLLCLIEASGQIAAYRFDDDESTGVRLPACARLPRNIVLVYDGEEARNDPQAAT
jgi:proteasome lid subunit RPN8/RPN11